MENNINISNKGNVFSVHWSMNNVGSWAIFSWTPSGFTYFALDPRGDTPNFARYARLGLFLGVLEFRILLCVCVCVSGVGAIFGGYGSFAGIYLFFVTFKTDYFWGSIKILGILFLGIVRISIRTFCWTDSCFYLLLTALFLLSISSVSLK